MITIDKVEELLVKSSIEVSDIEFIPEGSNHQVFIITALGKKMICKFPIIRSTETHGNLDTMFGGELSLERETYLYQLSKSLGVPAPEFYAHISLDGYDFILIELMKGMPLTKYIETSNFSKVQFLDVMKKLGSDFAKIQSINFNAYGNLIGHNKITPTNLFNFADRFIEIIDRRIERGINKGAFTSEEVVLVEAFFHKRINDFKPLLELKSKPATLVFTDMHADNFFVDETGKPSGYFDLESSQAAPAELEFYGFRFFLFNYFDEETFQDAEKAFFSSYKAAGGKYAPTHEKDHELIDFLSACRLLELTESYWGHRDGLRDLWAFKIKTLLMNYIFTLKVDYIGLSDIFREKTKQPRSPKQD
ncbi:aminoglycoside phosphotransferase family protein [Acidaminobacter sp. JC074]|uniref:phosphotransferase family protein n=1 Tax=Acidaminobacter sp. JC074 TaxID=2530199 RepID=UPI001F117CBF|nr:phosphotransferase [Acidaminobacter sp. JC074]MCH4886348.1 aminoglycoside phosphotransferase family protein [Acidaminobacter sp. JC074]